MAMHITKMFYPDFEAPEGFEQGFAQQPTSPPQAPPAPGGQPGGQQQPQQPQSPQQLSQQRVQYFGQLRQQYIDDPESLAAIAEMEAMEQKYGQEGSAPIEVYNNYVKAMEVLKRRGRS
jgi:hypothetical protein